MESEEQREGDAAVNSFGWPKSSPAGGGSDCLLSNTIALWGRQSMSIQRVLPRIIGRYLVFTLKSTKRVRVRSGGIDRQRTTVPIDQVWQTISADHWRQALLDVLIDWEFPGFVKQYYVRTFESCSSGCLSKRAEYFGGLRREEKALVWAFELRTQIEKWVHNFLDLQFTFVDLYAN